LSGQKELAAQKSCGETRKRAVATARANDERAGGERSSRQQAATRAASSEALMKVRHTAKRVNPPILVKGFKYD